MLTEYRTGEHRNDPSQTRAETRYLLHLLHLFILQSNIRNIEGRFCVLIFFNLFHIQRGHSEMNSAFVILGFSTSLS